MLVAPLGSLWVFTKKQACINVKNIGSNAMYTISNIASKWSIMFSGAVMAWGGEITMIFSMSK